MSDEVRDVFNHIWDLTLEGCNLQFYIVVSNELYFVNTYTIPNEKGNIIGAILFMRKFQHFYGQRSEERNTDIHTRQINSHGIEKYTLQQI